jgi:calcineurin-like phosphoesterase family protein
MKCWVTSDLHFRHKKLVEYEPFWRKYDSIIKRDAEIEGWWHANISSEDVIYVLGDVAWNREGLDVIKNLPGIKKLVMGNHDTLDMEAYRQVFRKITGYAVLNDVLLAHMPIHRSSVIPQYWGQIHGHTHGQGSPEGPYVSACLERTEGTPQLLEWYIKQLGFMFHHVKKGN